MKVVRLIVDSMLATNIVISSPMEMNSRQFIRISKWSPVNCRTIANRPCSTQFNCAKLENVGLHKFFLGHSSKKKRKIQCKNLELAANLQADSILKNMVIH